jgi:hypothetical protein
MPPYRRTRGPRADPRRPRHRLRQASPAAASGDDEEKEEGWGGRRVRVEPLSRLEETTRAVLHIGVWEMDLPSVRSYISA